MFNRNALFGALWFWFLFTPASVSAIPITFEFKAIVSYGGLFDDNTTVPVGTVFHGRFSYDTELLPEYGYSPPSGRQFGFYTALPPFGIEAYIAGHAIVARRLGIGLIDNSPGNVGDMVDMTGKDLTIDGSLLTSGSFGFRLASAPGNFDVLDGVGLPLQYDVAAFDAHSSLNYGWLQRDGGQTGRILGFRVTEISTVDEPSSTALLLGGLLLTAATRSRTRRNTDDQSADSTRSKPVNSC